MFVDWRISIIKGVRPKKILCEGAQPIEITLESGMCSGHNL